MTSTSTEVIQVNRRQVIGLYGAASAFPIAVALSSGADEAAAPGEIRYHVVYAFDRAVEDFRFPGIYTRREDAEAHAARLRADERSVARYPCIGVTEQPHDWLVNCLVSARLGQLSAMLQRLEKQSAVTNVFVTKKET
jgi:hypothetical protein